MNGSSCCFEGGWLFYLWGDCTELPISSGSFSSPVAIGQVSTWLKWQVSKFTNRTVRSRERTAASTSGTVDWSMLQDRGGSQHLQGGVTKLPVQGWGFKPPSRRIFAVQSQWPEWKIFGNFWNWKTKQTPTGLGSNHVHQQVHHTWTGEHRGLKRAHRCQNQNCPFWCWMDRKLGRNRWNFWVLGLLGSQESSKSHFYVSQSETQPADLKSITSFIHTQGPSQGPIPCRSPFPSLSEMRLE